MMASHKSNAVFGVGSFIIMRPWLSNTIRLRIQTHLGWENLNWVNTMDTERRYAFTIRSISRGRYELIVNNTSHGERATAGVIGYIAGQEQGLCIGQNAANPTGNAGAIKGRYHAVCMWDRTLSYSEVTRWQTNPLGMFTPSRRRMPTPPLYVPPTPPPSCDWFDPRTGEPWQNAQAAQDWHQARAGSSWQDGAADEGWYDDTPSGNWFDDKECS
jgi:hypothetical protein